MYKMKFEYINNLKEIRVKTMKNHYKWVVENKKKPKYELFWLFMNFKR